MLMSGYGAYGYPEMVTFSSSRLSLLDRGMIFALAHVRGDNRTDSTPLAQMSPLEARLALGYERGAWTAGALVRAVAAQDRYVVGQGNIVGQDIGPTGGFSLLSLNAAWRPRDGMLVAAGVDNLFDRVYAEHLSRAGAMVQGYVQTRRVNEPGRTLWLKASANLP